MRAGRHLDDEPIFRARDGILAQSWNQTGLDQAKKIDPDVILLDIILPQMDGFTVLKALKEDKATKNVPVVLLTNLGQDGDVKKGLELGAVDYLIKANFTPAQVVDKVKSVL